MFNRKKFFDGYRLAFGSLSQQQVKGLERLLDGIENDPHIPAPPTGLFWEAYMLATVKRETAHTFTPIHEYGGRAYFVKRYGGQTRKGKELGNDTPDEGYYYAGKSDVQLTGEANYEKAEIALRREYPEVVAHFERRTGKTFDLTVGDQSGDTSDPQNVLDPAISYAVMSYGMRTGLFTGKKLSQYTCGAKPNYKGMRGIINGIDHDDEIAADARKFETILKDSAAPATNPAKGIVSDAENEKKTISHDLLNEPPTDSEGNTDPPPSIVPMQSNVVEVETITAAPSDAPKAETVWDKVEKTNNRLASLQGAGFTLLSGVGSWLATNSVQIMVAVVAAAAVIAIAYMWINARRSSSKERVAMELDKERLRIQFEASEAAHVRAQEVQMAVIESARNKDMETIRILPPPPGTIIPNSDTEMA